MNGLDLGAVEAAGVQQEVEEQYLRGSYGSESGLYWQGTKPALAGEPAFLGCGAGRRGESSFDAEKTMGLSWAGAIEEKIKFALKKNLLEPTFLRPELAADRSHAGLRVPPSPSIAELESLYSFRTEHEKTDIASFVVAGGLADLLVQAHGHIMRIFGGTVDVRLQMHVDPEEDFEAVFIVVHTDLSTQQAVEDALDRLYEFYDEYWLDRDPDLTRLVGVDAENS